MEARTGSAFGEDIGLQHTDRAGFEAPLAKAVRSHDSGAYGRLNVDPAERAVHPER
ncbi:MULTISPECIES: hypothetical protein [Methylobacterium]|uniref:hypothetical protein n=1 Tax=Methylobacterium TaxID=407 RepID=UPI00164EE9EA|nr:MULTISPECIES: hypothetical protein [Methylobacterium]GJE21387.1 hypothetical protein JHFBIEKO_1829 [Methylobacterium mesophilicum]